MLRATRAAENAATVFVIERAAVRKSVPALRNTLYWAGVSRFRHSASVWVTTKPVSGDADVLPAAQAPIVTIDARGHACGDQKSPSRHVHGVSM